MEFTFLCIILEALSIYGLNFMFWRRGPPLEGEEGAGRNGVVDDVVFFVVLILILSFFMVQIHVLW